MNRCDIEWSQEFEERSEWNHVKVYDIRDVGRLLNVKFWIEKMSILMELTRNSIEKLNS